MVVRGGNAPPRPSLGKATLHQLGREAVRLARQADDDTEDTEALRLVLGHFAARDQQETRRTKWRLRAGVAAIVVVAMLVAAVAGVTYSVTRTADGGTTIEANPGSP